MVSSYPPPVSGPHCLKAVKSDRALATSSLSVSLPRPIGGQSPRSSLDHWPRKRDREEEKTLSLAALALAHLLRGARAPARAKRVWIGNRRQDRQPIKHLCVFPDLVSLFLLLVLGGNTSGIISSQIRFRNDSHTLLVPENKGKNESWRITYLLSTL